jgi:hypothetical protein
MKGGGTPPLVWHTVVIPGHRTSTNAAFLAVTCGMRGVIKHTNLVARHSPSPLSLCARKYSLTRHEPPPQIAIIAIVDAVRVGVIKLELDMVRKLVFVDKVELAEFEHPRLVEKLKHAISYHYQIFFPSPSPRLAAGPRCAFRTFRSELLATLQWRSW